MSRKKKKRLLSPKNKTDVLETSLKYKTKVKKMVSLNSKEVIGKNKTKAKNMDYSEIADLMHPGKKTVYKSKYFSYVSKIPEMLEFKRMSKKDADLMFGDKYDAVFVLTRYKPVSNKSNDYFLKTVKKAGILNGRLKNLGTWDVGPVSMNEFRWTLKKNGNKDIKFFETDKSVRITRGDDARKIWGQNAKNAEADARKLLKTGNKTSGCGGWKKRKTGDTSDDDLRKLLKSDNRRSASLRNLTKPPRGLPKMDSKLPSVPKSKSDSVFEMVYSKKGWW